jgi:hypothetical protein
MRDRHPNAMLIMICRVDKSKPLSETLGNASKAMLRLKSVFVVPPEELVVKGGVMGKYAAQECRLSAKCRTLGSRKSEKTAVRPP